MKEIARQKQLETDTNDFIRKAHVMAKIYSAIEDGWRYTRKNIFEGYSELSKDKEFIVKYINRYPAMYEYISYELREDRDVLIALASSPLCIYVENPGDYNKRSISPLFFILEEHNNRRVYTKTNRDGTKEVKEGEGFPFIVDEGNNSLKINDIELILRALRAELDSYEYSKKIEEKFGHIFSYDGIYLLDDLRKGKNVDFLDYMSLVTLQFASTEILENEEYKKIIEGVIQQWVKEQKAKDEKEKRMQELQSYDLDGLTQ